MEAIVTEAARNLGAEVEAVKAKVGPGNNILALARHWNGPCAPPRAHGHRVQGGHDPTEPVSD